MGSPDEEFVRTLLEAALGDTLDYMIGVGFLSFSYDVKQLLYFLYFLQGIKGTIPALFDILADEQTI